MVILHQLGRLEVVPSNVSPSVTVDVKYQTLTCMYFGACIELYLMWCVSLPAYDLSPVRCFSNSHKLCDGCSVLTSRGSPSAWELLQDLAAGLLQENFTQDPKILLSVQRRSA